jgi:hypothetical protein
MKRRSLTLIVPAGLLLTGIAAAPLLLASPTQTRSARAPDTIRPRVQWVFREADLMSCRSATYTLRHLRSQFGSRVDVVAVGIGVDEAYVRNYLRAERLDVPLTSTSAEAYTRDYGTQPATGLYVILGGRVVESFPAGPTRRYPDPEVLSSAIAGLFAVSHAIRIPPAPRRTS